MFGELRLCWAPPSAHRPSGVTGVGKFHELAEASVIGVLVGVGVGKAPGVIGPWQQKAICFQTTPVCMIIHIYIYNIYLKIQES